MDSPIVEPSTRVHAAIQSLLLEHGSFTPLELLIELDAVSYGDYESWRRGLRGTLAECVAGGEVGAQHLVDAAAVWAERLGLERGDIEYFGWEGHEGIRLVAANQAGINRLLCSEYTPKRNRTQLDLFFDSAENAAVNTLLDALAGRDSKRAQAALDGLSILNPNHRHLTDASCLVGALQAAPVLELDDAHRTLVLLENI